MTLDEFLAQFTNFKDFSRKSKILLVIYYLRKYHGITEFTGADIRRAFREAMIRIPSDLSKLLSALSSGRNSPLLKAPTKHRYSLSIDGVYEVEAVLAAKPSTAQRQNEFLALAIPHLSKTLVRVNDKNRRDFLTEAISCLKIEARRATIVMTWLTTVDHIQDYILAKKLNDFNQALTRRNDRYNRIAIVDKDDFGGIKESVFIEVCRSARIITNDVRKILDEKLGIRNSAAHPSTVTFHDTKVVNFIEDLVDNVILKYKLT